MDKCKIIKNIIENGSITTKELNELGFNSYMITKMVNDSFIVRKERGVYSLGKVDSILNYGIELLESRDKVNSKYIFDYCYGMEPNNYHVNVLLLSYSILFGIKEHVFKYFDFVYNYLKNNNREKDAYYILFMYSYCYGVPNPFELDYKSFLKSSIRSNECDSNLLREYVYTIDFERAKEKNINGLSSFENVLEANLETVLINKSYSTFSLKNNTVRQNISNGNYSKSKDILESRDKLGFLSYSQKKLLYLINVCLHVSLTGNFPETKEISDFNNFYLCIDANRFDLAKKILDNYYDTKSDIDRNRNAFYLVLDKLVELMRVVDDKNTKEMLNLDNVIGMIIDNDYSLVDEYLNSIDKSNYCFLIHDLAKLAEFSNNNLFVITTLISISTGDYKFNINNFVSVYMNALQNKEYDKARILLDIIYNSRHISNVDIGNSMKKLFDSVSVINNESFVIENSDDNGSLNERDDKLIPNNDSIVTIKNDDEVNLFESKIRKILDGLDENNPIALLPTVKNEDEMDEIFDIIDTYPNLKAFAINTSDGSQAVARYNCKHEYIDLKGLYASAKADYINHNYSDAIKKYRQLLTVGNPHPGIYGEYGLALRNTLKKDEAIVALKIATGLSKLKGGKLDYSGTIFDMTHYGYNDPNYEKKPYVDIKDYNPDDSSFGRDFSFLDDLIALVKTGDMCFDLAIDNLGLSEEDKNYARLVYARDCYYIGSFDIGDKYIEKVLKSKNKNDDILVLLDEIRRNKKFYQNRLDEDKKQLVLMY